MINYPVEIRLSLTTRKGSQQTEKKYAFFHTQLSGKKHNTTLASNSMKVITIIKKTETKQTLTTGMW